MKKEEVCVFIDSLSEREEAIKILQKAGLKMGDMTLTYDYSYLRTDEGDDVWYIACETLGRIKITLSQFEEILSKDQDEYETELMINTCERAAKNKSEYRVKTKEEFEATCERTIDGSDSYVCGESKFHLEDMSHLCGLNLTLEQSDPLLQAGEPISLKGMGNWYFTKEMITPILNVDLVDTEKFQNITPSTSCKISRLDESWGKKETENKVDYSEINLDILDLMAKRMNANKHKYPEGNSKRELNVKDLEWALFRHLKKMIKPIEGDVESYEDHLSAILCNASMILDQLQRKG